jgi:hypothetical protein
MDGLAWLESLVHGVDEIQDMVLWKETGRGSSRLAEAKK